MSWLIASSDEFVAVTPSNTALLTYPYDNGDPITRTCKGIYVGVAGDVAVKDKYGNSVTFGNLAAGMIHPIATKQILSTGTAATGIIAIF